MTNSEIYLQTQSLAQRLAEKSGHIADKTFFTRDSCNPKARQYFELAVVAQEFLMRHEMEDVIEAIEEDLPW